MAKEILNVNPNLEGVLCSGNVVMKLIVKSPEWFYQFDLIHILCPTSSKFICERLGGKIPIVTTIHHVVDWNRVSHNISGDMIMTVASEWEQYLLEKGISRERVMLVHNGINPFEFCPEERLSRASIRKRYHFSEGDFVVGYVGKRQVSTFDRKGVKMLEEAISRLTSTERNIALVIVGPGWSSLVARLRTAGISVTWYSYLADHKRLSEIYACMDCFWVTSDVEGGPVPLIEAMSCGLPCISTPVGIALDIVEPGLNGILVRKKDAAQLVAETGRLIQNSKLRESMGNSARRTIETRLPYGKVFSSIVSLYDRAVTNFETRYGPRKSRTSVVIYGRNLVKEEQLLWMGILKGLGEYRMAFWVGLKTLLQFPSWSVLKPLLRLLKVTFTS